MPARSMPLPHVRPASGHVYLVKRAKGPVWFAKYRLPDGRQVKQRIGPAHTGRGRPPAGHVTKRGAEAWLQNLLERADAQMLPGSACLAVTFREAAEEWLRYSAEERACKPSTLVQYRSAVRCHLVPAFGDWLIGDITPHDLERFRSTLTFSARSKNRLITEAHGIFKRAMKVYGLPRNPAAEVEMLRVRSATDLQVFSPEEVHAVVRAADSEQDAAIYMTAAFTGLRMPSLDAGAGVILTVPTSGFHPGRGGVLYVSSKFAVRGLVVQLAHELAPDIRVNGVAPGGTLATGLAGSRSLGLEGRALGETAGRERDLKSRTPLQVALRPEDHAGAYVLLASDRARGMTGEILDSDGGIPARG